MAQAAITPRRRSARLQASTTPARSTPLQSRLGSVLERDETPEVVDRNLDSVVERGLMGGHLKTPESARPKPSHEDMHPEYAHQGTVKMSNAGLQLGFADVKPYQSSPLRPARHADAVSPAPVPMSAAPSTRSRPSSDFNFKPEDEHTEEIRMRIMAKVREDSKLIKEEMRQERIERAEAQPVNERRIAKPKSRFSDAHEAEFGRMRSIADHVSNWKQRRAQSRGNSPKKLIATPETPVTAGLKRSHSKAELDATPETRTVSKPDLKRTRSKASLNTPSPAKAMPDDTSRLENTAPAKRRKVTETQDVSDARRNLSSPRKTGLPMAAITPTRASAVRSQSARKAQDGKSSTFGLQRSRSIKDVARPGVLRTASDKIASAVSSRVTAMKSILHKPQLKYSDDPVKIAAGTHLPLDRATPSVREGSPSMPNTPRPQHTLPRPTPKRVEFAPDTKGLSDGVKSPSPTKLPSIRLLPAGENTADSSPLKSSPSKQATVTYPTLPEPPTNDTASDTNRPNPLFSHPPSSRDFTFSPDKRIIFAGSKPTEPGPGQVPSSQPRKKAVPTSIRQIKPSGGSAAALAVSSSRLNGTGAGSARPAHLSFPAVPHGMTNKKRARDSRDDSSGISDAENRDPNEHSMAEESSPRKRAKMAAGIDVSASEAKLGGLNAMRSRSVSPVKSPGRAAMPKSSPLKTPRRQNMFGVAKPPATSPRKGLSLSRINFLAKPKERN